MSGKRLVSNQVSKAPGFLEKGCMPVRGWTCRVSYRGLVARISPSYIRVLYKLESECPIVLCIERDQLGTLEASQKDRLPASKAGRGAGRNDRSRCGFFLCRV